MKLKALAIKHMFVLLLAMFSTSNLMAMNHLEDYFKYRAEGKTTTARKSLDKWTPKSFEEESYKKYFAAVNENSAPLFWQLYQDLSKSKKMLKLQHDSIKNVLQIDLDSKSNITANFKNFPKVAKAMLSNLRAQPEGLEYELLYLKWILKNKNLAELCSTERARWLSQSTLELSEVVLGLESCPLTFKDFTYRIRMLIFAGQEAQARNEIQEYNKLRQPLEWERAFLQAVFHTNVGDPTAAYEIIAPFEKEVKNNDDYYTNFFFIAIRAGELKKAEEAVNYIIASATSGVKRREYNYQKAFLFYQTRRYKEAVKILNPLIASHRSHQKKVKTRDYDDLTWLRSWCYYLDKDAAKARETLMENQQWARDKARNLYWLAQAEWALDNRIEAVAFFKQLAQPVIEGKFFSYYNYLAWLRYESYKEFTTSELLRAQMGNLRTGRGFYVLPDGSSRSQEILKNYDAYFGDLGSTDEGSIQIVNQEEIAADEKKTQGLPVYTSKELKSEMSWADDLQRWGYRDLAKWHLFEIEKTLTGSAYANKTESAPLIRYYLDNEYYNRSLSLANSVLSPSGRRLSLQDEPLLWTALYPKAYEKNVKSEAEKRKLTPYLLWSIMKAETQYKYDAISPVGAVGLMQFMPYTSQKVAVMLNEKHEISDLFEPKSAVRYGAMYLRKLSDELGDQYPLIAAAYNGGPHRVKLWLRNFRESDGTNAEYDVFIEHIPFNETRAYVKRVLSYMLTYRKLYDEELNLASSRWLIEKNPYKLIEPIVLKEEWPFEREVASEESAQKPVEKNTEEISPVAETTH